MPVTSAGTAAEALTQFRSFRVLRLRATARRSRDAAWLVSAEGDRVSYIHHL